MSVPTMEFSSILATHIKGYVAHKRALGNHFGSEQKTIRLLDRYLVECGSDEPSTITAQVVDAFLASRPRHTARSYNTLLVHLRGFFAWLVTHEIVKSSPLMAKPRRKGTSPRPFLFDQDQARRLLDATTYLADNPRAQGRAKIYRMIFVLLYGLGLRVGEACRLTCRDVDFPRQLLAIRKAKFGKDRLVPFGPKIAGELHGFMHWRQAHATAMQPDLPLFTFDRTGQTSLHPNRVSQTFHDLLPQLNLVIPADTAPPHLHCLRHSFAVGTLLRWYRSGVDPGSHLLHLSTFLGHVSPASTAVYLTITTELLEAAKQRFARFAAPVLKEVSP